MQLVQAEMRLRSSFQLSCRCEQLQLAIATHGVVDVADLNVTVTEASGSRYMWIGAGCTKAKIATVDDVPITEARIRVDWSGVQVSPRAPALETEQVHAT
jgi:hypothetical protein